MEECGLAQKNILGVMEAFPVVTVDVVTQLCEFVNTHQSNICSLHCTFYPKNKKST